MNKQTLLKNIMLILFSLIIVLPSSHIMALPNPLDHFDTLCEIHLERSKNTIVTHDNCSESNWPLIYDRSEEDISEYIILDSKDNIIVTGRTNSNNPNETDFLTLKYNHSGELMWDAVFDGGKNDYVWDIAVDSQDNIIVYGFNYSLEGGEVTDFDFTFFLIKYDNSGVELWNKTIAFTNDCYPGGIAVDSQDNIIMTAGRGDFDAMSFFCYTMKMDQKGNELWSRTFTEEMLSIGFAVVVNEDDEIYIGGLAASFYGQGWIMVQYDSTGILQWYKHYNLGNNLYDLEISSDGNIIVVGQHFSKESNSSKWVVLNCGRNGNIIWKYEYDGVYHETGNDAAIDSQGNIVVLGSINSNDTYESCIIILDNLGDEVCMKKPSFDGYLLGLTINSDDTVIATGVINSSTDSNNADCYVCRFSDITPPTVHSFTPETGYVYLTDLQLIPLPQNTIIFGPITLRADVFNSSDVEKVEFYIDGLLQTSIDTPPYDWIWNEYKCGQYFIEIHVYDNHDNINRKIMTVWKFF